MAVNCWEFKSCGREPGGKNVSQMGVCPAATEAASDGLNGGCNGGRICWAIGGTFCGGVVQGVFAEKQTSCMTCEFFQTVLAEEGQSFMLLRPGQVYRVATRRAEAEAS